MFISLRPGEKVFINGAVLRADRKVSIELLNDVSFLLEAHVMQAADATTPLRQLYFTVQIMLINPGDAKSAEMLFDRMLPDLCVSFSNAEVLAGLKSVGKLVAGKRLFEALKTIRGLYAIEDTILSRAASARSAA